ncbi:hypothetical protein K0U00_37065, partial [Paenibacillus sepulcri]|nr:hypothetical protein [Paenibacillus sepulcri]
DQKQPTQSDITTTLTLGANSFSGIDNAGTPLIDGTDYTVSGSVVTIKKEYLAAQPIGMANLTFSFSAGQPHTLAVTVRDTARGRYIPVNNDDPDIFYDGAWQLGRNRGLGDYKDDVQYTEVTGDSFEYAFKGTGIEIITEKDSSQGDMDIYVDGELQQTVSAYSPSRQVQQPVFSIAGLADGPHTIKAVKKNGYYMLLDQLRVRVSDLISPDTASFDKSGPAQADVTVALAIDGSGLLGISNGNEALVPGEDYTASGNQVTIKKEYLASQPVGTTYLSFSLRGDYQNDVHATEANGDYFEYPFTGTGIDFISAKDSSLGDIDIYVDNEFKQTVSAQSDSRQTQQALFSISGLTNGPHTVKGVKKSGAYMLVDGLRFSVTSVEDEDLAAVEQDKTELAVGLAEGDQADRVTRPVTLPALGAAGSEITWTSS